MERILEEIRKIVGRPVSKETEIMTLVRGTKLGPGDLLRRASRRAGIKIKNQSLPRTIGEIEI